MGLFLLRFWPVLVPLLVYALWMWRVRNKARKIGAPPPDFRDGPWFWAVMASLLTAVVMFLVIGLSHSENRGDYTPPHVENGKLVPGKVTAP